MNWPLFTNPALLGGLAAVAIPVLVHLLLKSRKQRLRFSTLLFFKQQDPRATQRRKLRNWLLLTLRVLALVLLALGFARPYLSGHSAAASDTPRRQVILVVDRSASMMSADHEGSRWNRATLAMRKLLSSLGPGDLASLVSCGPRAENLLGPAPAENVLELLQNLQPMPVAADLGPGLDLASKLVAAAGPGYSNTIYVVSDLQRNSCHDLASHPVPVSAAVQVMNFGDKFAPNTAITQFKLEALEAKDAAQPDATLSNFSDEDTPPLKAQFLVDGKEAQATIVALRANTSTNIDLALPRLAPGWHSGVLRVQSTDALALDNTRYRTIYVPPPVQILVVEPHPQVQVFRQETFFLISALDPAFGTTNTIPSPFQVTKISVDELMGKLEAKEGRPQVVILPGLRSLPSGLGDRLTAFVREGGGLLMFLNDSVRAIQYRAEFGELLPAELGTFESTAELDWRLGETDSQSPVFAAFRRPNSGNLMLSKFTRRSTLRGFDGNTIHARFQDGVPLVAGRELGKGRTLLVNSSADTSWTDWPKHRTYVPWIHSATRYLEGNGVVTSTNLTATYVSGVSADLNLGSGLKNTPCKLQRPEGPDLTGTTDEAGVWRDCPLAAPGIYTVRAANGRELRRIAVNPPVSESDLAALSPLDFEQQLVHADPPSDRSLAASLLAGADGRLELWRLCLLTALGLLFLELALANRTHA